MNGTERKARIAAFNRRERITKLAIWLAIVAFLIIYAWTWRRRAPWENPGSVAVLCAERYHQARTLADTQVVDVAKPFIDKADLVASISCGELRRAGRIK